MFVVHIAGCVCAYISTKYYKLLRTIRFVQIYEGGKEDNRLGDWDGYSTGPDGTTGVCCYNNNNNKKEKKK